MTITRTTIVAEARSWIGTPYRHQASLKGVGCDCLGLVRGVWRAVLGAEPEAVPAYAADWAEASNSETLAAAAARHLTAIAGADVRPGDLTLFRWRTGFAAKHAAIVTAPDLMVHGRAPKVLQRCLGIAVSEHIDDATLHAAGQAAAKQLIAAICDERLRFLQGLRTWPVFGNGWGRRVAEVRAAALAMADHAAAVPQT